MPLSPSACWRLKAGYVPVGYNFQNRIGLSLTRGLRNVIRALFGNVSHLGGFYRRVGIGTQ